MAGKTITYTCIQCKLEVTKPFDKRKKNIYCSKFCATRRNIKNRNIPKPIVAKFSGRTKLINGKYIVNEEYYVWLNQWTWHTSDTGYAVMRNTINGKKKTVRMHRLVLDTPEDLITDHKNHNRLDNRHSNLRVVTHKENMQNTRGRGYCFDTAKGKWLVTHKRKYYGRYNTESEAQNASKLARSGVPAPKRLHRKNYHFPQGVFRNKGTRQYQAKITINGVRHYLGVFPTVNEAEEAYNTMKERIKL